MSRPLPIVHVPTGPGPKLGLFKTKGLKLTMPDGTAIPGIRKLELIGEVNSALLARATFFCGIAAYEPNPEAVFAETKSPAADVLDEIAAERRRQVTSEGYSAEHDDGHDAGELAAGACAYALCAADLLNPHSQGDGGYHNGQSVPIMWPWEALEFKPKDPRRDLIRAAALIVAEIERLDREHQGAD